MFECRPVSTNVMRQSWMSLVSSSMLAAAFRQDEVVRHALVVVEEELPDQVAAIAEAEDEVLVAEVRVVAHQVPEDRPVADVDERLGNRVGVLAQAGSQSAAEQYDFHSGSSSSPRSCCRGRARALKRDGRLVQKVER